MQYTRLGPTGLRISRLAFGGGPISTLMTGDDYDRQLAVVERAVRSGINWVDTAATYGNGHSETNLGRVLRRLDEPDALQIATKVRLTEPDLQDIPRSIETSCAASLQRLGVERVTLLQLHNSITAQRDDEPTSISVDDVLQPGGVLDAFEKLRARGWVEHLGLTGLGQPQALRSVVQSRGFATIQLPYNLMNPRAGRAMGDGFPECDYGQIIDDCVAQGMGVMAIRVFAAGALVGQDPAPHTFTTRFFPLDLYRRDQQRTARMQRLIFPDMPMAEAALRFVVSNPQLATAIIGFAEPEQIDQAIAYLRAGVLEPVRLDRLAEFDYRLEQAVD